ncbi:MAG: E3 binding domain-containing protein, partial [Betaproteobacteria bacterium]|nr:E3 binding domain-containing protein [Betaproteobacteria bacterium]
MFVEVKVPQLSESVAEATLLTWHKKAGDYVKRDENLVDIETDKVVLETPAPEAGVLAKVLKGDGGTVVSKEVIATIDTEGPPAAKAAEPVPAAAVAAAKPAAAAPARAGAAPVMPAAQKLAAEKKVDVSEIAGTGRGGRVTKADVLERIQPPAQPAPRIEAKPSLPQPPAVDIDQLLAGRPEQRVPMSRLRARIAERLVQSQHTAA